MYVLRKRYILIFFFSILSILVLGFVFYPLWHQRNDTLSIVKPAVETNPAHHIGDTADDTCVWINPNNKWLSLIIGDDKDGGLCVWNLDGTENQYLDPESDLNNLDIRYDFSLGKQKVPLIGVVNENGMSLRFYTVDSNKRLVSNIGSIPLDKEKPYGGCMYLSNVTKQYYFFVNWKDGTVQQWQLDGKSGEITGRMVRTFNVGSQVEGCVADDQMGYFYIGEEAVGVWKYGAEPGNGSTRTMVDSVDKQDGGHLTADVEGMTIYYGNGDKGYLICSSQGNSTFQVYNRKTNQYLHSFTIGPAGTIDLTTETDGCDVSNADFGGPFSEGVFIAHDHINDCTDRTNVKLVTWKEIQDAIDKNI
jgi:3-phytase